MFRDETSVAYNKAIKSNEQLTIDAYEASLETFFII